jgi:hypothetical protein
MSQAALNRCVPREESASLRLPVVPLRAAGSSFYRPELDVLRFFAFYGVFRFHFALAVSRYVAGGPFQLIGSPRCSRE